MVKISDENRKYYITDHDDEFRYMFLSRLQSDCEYFLGYGRGYVKKLYFGDIEYHIAMMVEVFNSLPKVPEWISLDDIKNYEYRMLNGLLDDLGDFKF